MKRFILALIIVFNSLIWKRNRVKNAWHQIDVQLQRRYDLVPNLVETVKGYAKHERGVFTEVTKARTAMMNAGTIPQKAKASNMLTNALKSLFAVAEAYPDLKASANFMQLQEELSGIESKIAYARQFYNDSVLSFNTAIQIVHSRGVFIKTSLQEPDEHVYRNFNRTDPNTFPAVDAGIIRDFGAIGLILDHDAICVGLEGQIFRIGSSPPHRAPQNETIPTVY